MVLSIWCYFCKACDNHFGRAATAEDYQGYPERLDCPSCAASCRKLDKPRQDRFRVGRQRADIGEYFSEAMGVGPGEPGLPGEHYNADGDLLVRGRAHKRELMRKLNYREIR